MVPTWEKPAVLQGLTLTGALDHSGAAQRQEPDFSIDRKLHEDKNHGCSYTIWIPCLLVTRQVLKAWQGCHHTPGLSSSPVFPQQSLYARSILGGHLLVTLQLPFTSSLLLFCKLWHLLEHSYLFLSFLLVPRTTWGLWTSQFWSLLYLQPLEKLSAQIYTEWIKLWAGELTIGWILPIQSVHSTQVQERKGGFLSLNTWKTPDLQKVWRQMPWKALWWLATVSSFPVWDICVAWAYGQCCHFQCNRSASVLQS